MRHNLADKLHRCSNTILCWHQQGEGQLQDILLLVLSSESPQHVLLHRSLLIHSSMPSTSYRSEYNSTSCADKTTVFALQRLQKSNQHTKTAKSKYKDCKIKIFPIRGRALGVLSVSKWECSWSVTVNFAACQCSEERQVLNSSCCCRFKVSLSW